LSDDAFAFIHDLVQVPLVLFPQVVEVLGRYLNHADQGERIRQLLELDGSRSSAARSRTQKQVQHRLSTDEIDELVAKYLSGETIQALAARFKIHRFTVSQLLDRREVSRHSKGVPLQRLQEVIRSYEVGDSLATIAARESVSPETVGLALRKEGVQIRK
jgi:hypothetical protein